MYVMGLKKISVSTAAIHDFLAELALELADRFLNDAWQPLDAVDGFWLRWQGGGFDAVFGGVAFLDVKEVVAAYLLDGLGDFVGWLASVDLIFPVVEEVLDAPAVFRDER